MAAAPDFQINSTNWGNFARRPRASLAKSFLPLQESASGEMAEWLKAHAWKACVRETVPWVRIPLSPPVSWHDNKLRHINGLVDEPDGPTTPLNHPSQP